jgi:hypothetical protein
MRKKEKNKIKIIAIVAVVLIIAVLAAILGFKIWNDKEDANIDDTAESIGNSIEEPNTEDQDEKEEQKEIEIYSGTDRPIAVMIDNHKGAWPQAGLNKAYLVYEIIVEGGETRLMALFKGQDLNSIGPVRSSRHYFLDYAMENDAIYVHYGWSPQAKSDISTYSVNNINGIYYSTSDFRRITGKSSPHNVMTSTSSILSIAKKLGYRTTSTATSVLNYTTDEVNLESGIDATSVTIPHSSLQKVKYEYDSTTQRYTRYARGTLQKDYSTGESVTTKNIIIEFIDNSTLSDGSSKGRQTISNIGTFNGYYITNGKAIKITCTKSSRTSKTVYKDLSGNVIDVNDGNTWINICPKNANVVIE